MAAKAGAVVAAQSAGFSAALPLAAGGGATKTVARTVTVTALAVAFALMLSAAAGARATPTYVERGGVNVYLRHPSLLSFSVDGDLEGLHLRWNHWGAGFTIAHGKLYERQGYPTYSSSTVPGAIKLDHLRPCDGARYYTRAVFYPYAALPFKAGPVRLYTPCNGG